MIGADAVRGHIDLIVLALLEHTESYAYEMSRLIEDASSQQYVVKQTTLYTALKRLEAQGALTSRVELSATGKPRTYYRITGSGEDLLLAKREEWQQTRSLIDQFSQPQTSED